MPTVDIWQNQGTPGARLAPVSGTSVAEAFGAGLQNIGQAGANLAADLQRHDEIIQQKNDAAWLGKTKPQSILDLDKITQDLEDNAPAGAPGHADAVSKRIDEYAADAIKAAPDEDSKADLGNYLTGLKAHYVGEAGRYQATSELGLRVSNIDAAGDKWGNILVQNPGRFDLARAEMFKTIDAQGLKPDKAASEKRRAEQNLSTFAMNGQSIANPKQFLAGADAGKWDAVADPSQLASAKARATAQVKADDAEAKRAWREQQVIVKATTKDRVGDYVTSVRNNGGVPPMVNGQPLVTKEQVRKVYADDPTYGEYLVQQMDTNQQIGQYAVQTQHTTPAEDAALLSSLSPKPEQVFTGDDAEKLKAVSSFVDAKQKQNAADAEVVLKGMTGDAQNAVAKKYDDWSQTAFATGKVPDEAAGSIDLGYDGARADELKGKLKQQAELGKLKRDADAGSLDDDSTLYKAAMAEASAGGEGSAFAADRANLLKQVLDDKYKKFNDSPAAFVVGDSGPLKAKWDTFTDLQQKAQAAPNDPALQNAAAAAGKAASSATVDEQVRRGLPVYKAQAIPDPLAQQYAYSVQNAQPEQRPAIAREIMNLGPQALGQVIKAGAPPTVAAYAAVTDPLWTNKLTTADKMSNEDQGKLLQTRGVKRSEMDDAVTGAFSALSGTIPPSSQAAYRDAITEVAIVNVGRGMSRSDAVANAMAPFTAGMTISAGLRIPNEISAPDAERGLRSVVSGIASGRVPVKVIPSGLPGATSETDAEAIKQAATAGGLSWMTNENSTGAILTLPDGSYLQNPDGSRFEIMFDAAQAKGRSTTVPTARMGYKSGVSQ